MTVKRLRKGLVVLALQVASVGRQRGIMTAR